MGKKLKIEKSRRRDKWNILKYGDDIFERDMLTGPHIEIFGNNKISIDGCKGVVEYKDTYLKLKLPKGSVILCGADFDIVYFENRLITVRGKLTSVEFCV